MKFPSFKSAFGAIIVCSLICFASQTAHAVEPTNDCEGDYDGGLLCRENSDPEHPEGFRNAIPGVRQDERCECKDSDGDGDEEAMLYSVQYYQCVSFDANGRRIKTLDISGPVAFVVDDPGFLTYDKEKIGEVSCEPLEDPDVIFARFEGQKNKSIG